MVTLQMTMLHTPKCPVINEAMDDNLIHIQPHMLSGTLTLAFITLSGRNHEYSCCEAESDGDDAAAVAPVDCGH